MKTESVAFQALLAYRCSPAGSWQKTSVQFLLASDNYCANDTDSAMQLLISSPGLGINWCLDLFPVIPISN